MAVNLEHSPFIHSGLSTGGRERGREMYCICALDGCKLWPKRGTTMMRWFTDVWLMDDISYLSQRAELKGWGAASAARCLRFHKKVEMWKKRNRKTGGKCSSTGSERMDSAPEIECTRVWWNRIIWTVYNKNMMGGITLYVLQVRYKLSGTILRKNPNIPIPYLSLKI